MRAHLLVGRRCHLEVVADADAAALAPAAALGAAGGEPIPIRSSQCVFQQGREIAAVVHHRGRRAIRHLLRPDVVAAAQLHPVDPHLTRGRVDQTLHVVVALWPPRAAVGAHRRGVGEHALADHLHQRGAVDADHVLHRVHRLRQRRGVAEIRADIAEARHPHREEVTLGVQRQFARHVVVAAVAVGQEAVGARVGPLDRTAQHARGMQHGDVFRIHAGLHAERAADIAGQHAHLLGRRRS